MNGITLTIDDTEVRRLLAGMQERGSNLRPALNVAATMMQQAVRNNFAQGGRPKWLPLKSRDGQPLRDTGRLMNSLTREATQTEARVGTNVVYAAIHNFGGKAGRGRKVTIPQREFMVIPDEEIEDIQDLLQNWIVEGKL